MGRTYEIIDGHLKSFIESQPVFFIATAPIAQDGHINISPKGNRDELKVLDRNRIAYADQTGSGIETTAHIYENGRIVLMVCSFTGKPRIVRLHGKAICHERGSSEYSDVSKFFIEKDGFSVRSFIEIIVDRISDSCGYGVPLMDFVGHRPHMDDWSERKGEIGIRDYIQEKNRQSIDGLKGLTAQ